MTNFITLLISLSECSKFKPNYHTRAKLKAFPLNCCNPSPDKRTAPLPFASSIPVFKQQHSSSETTQNQQLIIKVINTNTNQFSYSVLSSTYCPLPINSKAVINAQTLAGI